MDEYQLAQRAIADLKTAVLRVLRSSSEPLSNAQVGRSSGIYMGYRGGNVGHVPRVLLGLLEDEGLVTQTSSDGRWAASPASPAT